MADVSQIRIAPNSVFDLKDSTARRIASANQTGQVKVDGTTVTIDADGTIHSAGGSSGISVTATLLAASWDTQNQQTVTFTGYQASMNGVIGVPASATDAQKEAYASALVRTVAQNGNQFTFECESIPSIDLPVTIYAGGSSGGGGVPVGGTTNQALLKNSNTDEDTKWANVVMPRDIAPTESTSTSSKAYAVGDLFYYEGVLYKVTTAIAQGGSIVTSGSGQNVEVDTVSGELGEIQNQIDVVRDNGAVNYLPYPYDSTSGVINGVTITDLGNGKIKIGGSSEQTATGGVLVDLKLSFKLPKTGTYKITGCPSDGSDVTYMLRIWVNDILAGSDLGNGFTATINDSDIIRAFFYIRSGTTIPAGGFVVMPMISDARLNLSYADYKPYAITNTVLTQKVSALQKTGCVNVMPNTAISSVDVGISYVVNADKTVSASGLSTDVSAIYTCGTFSQYVKNDISGPFKFVGSPTVNGVRFVLRTSSDGVTTTGTYEDFGSGVIVPDAPYIKAYIRINNGVDLSTPAVFKPMLTTDLSATYADYHPYSMTNRELTEAVDSGSTTVSSSHTYSSLFFQKYGGVKQVNIRGLLSLPADTATVLCNLPDGYGVLLDGRPTDFWVSNGVKIRIAFSKASNNITAKPYGTDINDSDIDLLITYI